ncbi:alpha/beta fold hydrolase [Acuticoccus mangrovi]|uniref:Alpha/beta fold hydrolase n=1 Tax=Acuticoccus mangrovi TaxID=2796142 RepID=A0A934MG61_9HYPH|nr:alpha/beta fold hydrolase [Acuticoccus mangrovi]MBJ3775630.1 alpha/beta fold hydrolase [Acuticoccus mangrovi]
MLFTPDMMDRGDARLVPVGDITMGVTLRGAGKPIVFIHGLGWDRRLWAGEAERLAGRYLTVTGDSRGHGLSDKPEGPYSIDMLAADWIGVIDALGLADICLVGFSQGGMIAQTIMRDRPELVSALMLVSTSPASAASTRENMEKRLAAEAVDGARAAAEIAAASIFSPAWRERHPDTLEAFLEWRVTADQAALASATRALYDFDVTGTLPAVAVPTLVVAGVDDVLTKPAGMQKIAELVPGAEYLEVADSGHMIPIEQPAAFSELIDRFLARHFAA